MTDEADPSEPEVGRSRQETADPDLLHDDAMDRDPPDGPARDEGAGLLPDADTDENEPPIERHDGQVYGG